VIQEEIVPIVKDLDTQKGAAMVLQGVIAGVIASSQLMNLISLGPQLFISFHSF